MTGALKMTMIVGNAPVANIEIILNDAINNALVENFFNEVSCGRFNTTTRMHHMDAD